MQMGFFFTLFEFQTQLLITVSGRIQVYFGFFTDYHTLKKKKKEISPLLSPVHLYYISCVCQALRA